MLITALVRFSSFHRDWSIQIFVSFNTPPIQLTPNFKWFKSHSLEIQYHEREYGEKHVEQDQYQYYLL